MTLKLQLVRGDKIVFEMPLSFTDWPKEQLENELDAFQEDFQRFSKIFDALSSETRLMMMKHLIEGEDHTISFADFMQELDLNPKLVWENARKLGECGLLTKVGRGRYRCSEAGETGFIMVGLAFKRLMKTLNEDDEL